MYYSKYGSPEEMGALNFAQISKSGNETRGKSEISVLVFCYFRSINTSLGTINNMRLA